MNELQPSGAFVIQFRAGTDFSENRIAGRIEHIASGRSGQFESADTMLGLLAGLLKEARAVEPVAITAAGRRLSDAESR